ncbi:MAG: hypothetical protein COA63_005250 [Methylophaga sp.]|nr:hypothetical protein [Methylophaga sp.]
MIATENSGFVWHVKNAKAGTVIDYPFKQSQLNQSIEESLTLRSEQYAVLSENAKQYCLAEDVHNLAGVAADVIESELFSSK